MITDEIKFSNKMQYLELLKKLNIDITALTKLLDDINYFEAPATEKYFGAYAGGLCEYALNLYNELAQLSNAYFPKSYSQEDIIKVTLLRDVYRAVMFEFYMKSVKNDTTGEWEKVGAYKTREVRPCFGGIGFSSYMMLKDLVSFSNEQIEAICYSSGDYTVDIHNIRREYKLITLTEMADKAATYFYTEETNVSTL